MALVLGHHMNAEAFAGASVTEVANVNKNGGTIFKLCNLCAVE